MHPRNPFRQNQLVFPIEFTFQDKENGIGRVTFHSRKEITVYAPGLGLIHRVRLANSTTISPNSAFNALNHWLGQHFTQLEVSDEQD